MGFLYGFDFLDLTGVFVVDLTVCVFFLPADTKAPPFPSLGDMFLRAIRFNRVRIEAFESDELVSSRLIARFFIDSRRNFFTEGDLSIGEMFLEETKGSIDGGLGFEMDVKFDL